MITLFRRLRQKLIDSGSVTKYLLYAVGEILLVVIGILIALQINNWNEERKNMIKVENYTQSLIADLVKDSTAIAGSLELIRQETDLFIDFQERLSGATATADTVRQIFQNEFSPITHRFAAFNDNTFNVLIMTGDIGLFPESVSDGLLSLHAAQDEALSSRNTTWENFNGTITDFSQKFPMPLSFSMINKGPIYDELLARDEADFISGFNSFALAKQNIYRVSVGYLAIVEEQTHQLLTLLRDTK